MSIQITKRVLERRVAHIAKITRQPIVIEYAYGQPCLYLLMDEETAAVETFSPRLSKRELYDWVNAWYEGFQAGWKTAEKLADLPLPLRRPDVFTEEA